MWNIAPYGNHEDLYSIQDNLSKVWGNHLFKAGVLLAQNEKVESSGNGADRPTLPGNCTDSSRYRRPVLLQYQQCAGDDPAPRHRSECSNVHRCDREQHRRSCRCAVARYSSRTLATHGRSAGMSRSTMASAGPSTVSLTPVRMAGLPMPLLRTRVQLSAPVGQLQQSRMERGGSDRESIGCLQRHSDCARDEPLRRSEGVSGHTGRRSAPFRRNTGPERGACAGKQP